MFKSKELRWCAANEDLPFGFRGTAYNLLQSFSYREATWQPISVQTRRNKQYFPRFWTDLSVLVYREGTYTCQVRRYNPAFPPEHEAQSPARVFSSICGMLYSKRKQIGNVSRCTCPLAKWEKEAARTKFRPISSCPAESCLDATVESRVGAVLDVSPNSFCSKNPPHLQPASAGARLVGLGVTAWCHYAHYKWEDTSKTMLSPHEGGCPSPALALSLPRRGRKPESTFWWEQRAWQAHKYHTAYPFLSVLWKKRLTLRKHLITLDLCHFAAYLNELKGRAGSRRDWGEFHGCSGVGKGQPGPAWGIEVSIGQVSWNQPCCPFGSWRQKGAEQGWVLKVPLSGDASAGAHGSWVTVSGDLKWGETRKRGEECFKPPQCIYSMECITSVATPLCRRYAWDARCCATAFAPMAPGIPCLCPILHVSSPVSLHCVFMHERDECRNSSAFANQ